jgi:hypothetical protein
VPTKKNRKQKQKPRPCPIQQRIARPRRSPQWARASRNWPPCASWARCWRNPPGPCPLLLKWHVRAHMRTLPRTGLRPLPFAQLWGAVAPQLSPSVSGPRSSSAAGVRAKTGSSVKPLRLFAFQWRHRTFGRRRLRCRLETAKCALYSRKRLEVSVNAHATLM